MKPLSAGTLSHIAGEVTTLCTCWKATLKNGTVYGFTDNTENLTISGVTYEAVGGYTPSNVTSSNNLAVDNLNVIGVLDSSAITEADITAGLWDYAEIEIFQVNYKDLTQIIPLRSGELGTVTTGRTQFVSELRGMMQKYQNIIGEVTTPTCRATFCDSRCTLNVATYTVTGTVTSVNGVKEIFDTSRTESDNYFAFGKITFTSGLNNGLSMEVKSFTQSTGKIEIFLAFPFEVQVGDTYSMIAGCDKRLETCVSFNNVINFVGEPHIPGQDKAFEYGSR